MSNIANKWKEALLAYNDKRVLIMFCYGFSSGLPLLLIFSSLSLWLREAGIDKGSVTYFSWAALGFSFKFIWAPLIDQLPVPWLSEIFGRRKSWLLLAQIAVSCSIVAMGLVNPQGGSLTLMALAAVALGFSAATQDIVIDAFRIEMAESELQAILSSVYIAGYRVAMIVSGAGALYFAQFFGSSMESYSYNAWMWTYFIMAAFMFPGLITTFFATEPELKTVKAQHSRVEYIHFFILFILMIAIFVSTYTFSSGPISSIKIFLTDLFNNKALGSLIGESFRLVGGILLTGIIIRLIAGLKLFKIEMVKQGYVAPIQNFFERYGTLTAALLLSLVGLYRISDIVLGVISNVFYQDLGFTKVEIANVVKTFGLIMSLLGGFLGGILTTRFGVIKILLWGAILSAATNLLFMLLANLGHNVPMLYVVISADNLAAGIASAAFVAFLSSLTDISFTAVQYAIFTSLMTLFPKVLGGYSGSMVESMGYSSFFMLTAIIGLPVIYLVMVCGKRFKTT